MGGTRESTTLQGEVRGAGRDQGAVDLWFPDEGVVACRAGPELAEVLGVHRYKRVSVAGCATRDGQGRLVEFAIESLSRACRSSPSEALAVLHAAVESALDPLDAEALVAERH
ncbi:MAG: hypothetical protein ABMB14_34315 [Myxococcota bacterium]